MIPERSAAAAPELVHTSVAAPGAANEDAFWVRRGLPTILAIADGAGRAAGSARRALDLFGKLIEDALETDAHPAPSWTPSSPRPWPVVPPPSLRDHDPDVEVSPGPPALVADLDSPEHPLALFPSWTRWITLLDSALLGGPESTFLGVALLSGRLTGSYVGGDRALLLRRDGTRALLTDTPGGPRLGSGECRPQPIHVPVSTGDVVLLASDGLWKALSLDRLDALVRRTPPRRFGELPALLVEAASGGGRDDDMTVALLRVPTMASAPRRALLARRYASDFRTRVHQSLRWALFHEHSWVEEDSTQLTWYTPKTRVQVTVDEPRRARWGEELVQVRVETVLATRVRAAALALTGAPFLDPQPAISALVYDPTWRRCSYVTKLGIAERCLEGHVAWLHTLLLLQVSRAHRVIDGIVHQLDARPPSFRHPLWGCRNQSENVVVGSSCPDPPSGEQVWDRRDLDSLLALVGQCTCATTGQESCRAICEEVKDAGGDTVELSLGNAARVEVAVGVFEPWQGRALCVRLLPRLPRVAEENVEIARRLNRLEARGCTAFGLVGSWTVEADEQLSFSTVLPEQAYMPNLAAWVCWAAAKRAKWARDAYRRVRRAIEAQRPRPVGGR